jgi:hypothetical protein
MAPWELLLSVRIPLIKPLFKGQVVFQPYVRAPFCLQAGGHGALGAAAGI